MDETFDTVEVTFNEETGIGHLTLNRPDALNALSGQLQEDIVEGLRVLEAENENGAKSRFERSSSKERVATSVPARTSANSANPAPVTVPNAPITTSSWTFRHR